MRDRAEHLVVGILVFAALSSGAAAGQAGTLVAWGWNDYGQCDVPAGDNFVAVSAGWKESLGLRADGSIVAWGDDRIGATPSGNDYTAISLGLNHALALRADGSITAWGSDYYGQCDVPTGNDFTAIAAGQDHNLALRQDGSLVSWGRNANGVVENTPDGNDFVAIGAGASHSVTLHSNGSITAWGHWENGGWVPGGSDFTAIAAGAQASHSLALREDGTLVGWGSNYSGESDPPDGGDFVAMSCGARFSVAQKADASMVAWGRDDNGETDVPTGTTFLSFSCGTHHAVGIVQPTLAVSIDIKPGSDDNPVNLKANGLLPVAILGSDTFDVGEIDQTTLALAGAEPQERGNSGNFGAFEDVNSDGFMDLMLRFPIADLSFEPGATEAMLTGSLLDGTDIAGSDWVRLLLPGDANDDGVTNLVDFSIMKSNFGLRGKLADGDFNEDGDINLGDFSILKSNFGTGAAPTGNVVAIPEPATLLAVTAVGLPLLRRRRRR